MRQIFKYNILAVILITFFSCTSTKQSSTTNSSSKEDVVQAINSDRWIFTANQVMPQRGRSSIVTGQYQVVYNKDTVIIGLPYFGRAYSANVMETRSPLDFTTKDFSTTKEQNNKGGWTITLKPKDNPEVREMMFSLFENGSAQLNVQLANRSPISFSGFVSARK